MEVQPEYFRRTAPHHARARRYPASREIRPVSRHRRSVLALAATLAGLALLMPSAAVLCWAKLGALSQEHSTLDTVALAAAERSQRIFDKVAVTLAGLHALRADDACATATAERLGAATIATREIDEIGLYRDGRISCNSWGHAGAPLRLEALDRLPGSKLYLHHASYSQANPQARLIGLYDGHLYAYVEPGRLVDVVLPANLQLAIFTLDGHLLASKNVSDLAQAEAFARRSGDGVLELDDKLVVRRTDGGLRSVASLPMRQVSSRIRQYMHNALPLTVLISLLGMVGVVAWVKRRLSLAGELRRAIAQDELNVHYQPIIELASGRCVGAEALVRWRHPRGDWIAPDVIIAKAERHGLVGRITELVMRRVVAELGPALRQHPAMHVSINLAAQDMRDNGPLRLLDALLEEHGVAHCQLWLEVTERGFVDVASASVALAPSRRQGCLVAVDDFGTGFSSLAYLQSLPLDVLKVDKAFVDAIDDGGGTAVIDHIIGMARSLGLRIVAEGIERSVQVAYLRAHQVQYGQGWLFARAMPAADFIAYWQQHGSRMSDPGQDQGHGRQ